MGCPNGSVIGFSFLSFYSFLPFDGNYFLIYFVFSSEYRNFAVINRVVTELSHVVQERAEGPKAPSPGHRPGYNSNQQDAL